MLDEGNCLYRNLNREMVFMEQVGDGPDRKGKKVAVIGSGPSGLVAAQLLNRRGQSLVYGPWRREEGRPRPSTSP